MDLNKLVEKLNEDLNREYMHMHFYLHAASTISGTDREEYREFLLDAAKSELNHIHEFTDMIIGLGYIPTPETLSYPTNLTRVREILEYALQIEDEVVERYVQRMDDAEELEKEGGLNKVHGRFIHIFLENQIMDSRTDADNIRRMLR